MVEVRAELQGPGVYLAGEWVGCAISFSNHSGAEETIAWAGAQLHCQCCLREDVVRGDGGARPLKSPVTNTTFIPNRGERGHTLLSTPTTVLLCNLSLQPGETKSFMYNERVPSGGPPSFGGRLVRYSYKVAIGAQKPNCPAQIIRIPFRLMTIPESLCNAHSAPSPKDANPFLAAEEVKEDPCLELALQALAAETSRRTSMNYTLKSSHGVLGRISLFKPSYKLGEDITGTFDLALATVACLQFSVVLQCLEEVAKESLQPSASRNSVITHHARHTECCHNTCQTHFALPVPLSVTQSFQTSIVSVRWQLQFEFLVGRCPPSELLRPSPTASLSGDRAVLWRGLQPVAVDTMTWHLPLSVLPTLPTQAQHRTPPHTLTL